MHQKRNEMLKTWPVPRKGTKYLVVSSHAKSKGIPILFVLRELLKLAQTRKELKHMLLNKEIKVNYKMIRDEKFPMQISDILHIEKLGKEYRLTINGKKFTLKEVKGKEAEIKIVKIIGKRVIEKNKIQINLEDGRNFFVKENFSVGDSAVINLKENKIEKILKLKEGAKVKIIGGKHLGKEGTIKEERQLERNKIYIVNIEKKEINLPLKTIMVIE
jgi:small subunit ribosomal protein S4e